MTKTKIENLKINSLPNLCGVYIFKLNNEILYIGKAKNIKKRVSQYFNGSINSYKTPLLISKVNNIDYIVCSNEKEALLLEQELIKKNKPYYNVLLLDDKKYPYIVVELKSNKLEFKTKFFYKHSNNSYYYGPLPPNYGYKVIKNFLIRECLYENGLPIQSNDFNFWKTKFEYAKKILSSSNNKDIINKIKKQMLIASENEQYELATEFRNVIQYLSNKFENQSITFNIDKDFDVIVFKEHDDLLFVVIHYFKNGSFFMQEDYVLEIKIDLYQTVIDFLNYFYSNRNQPDFMITNIQIEANDLIFKNKIILPKQGKYSRAIDNALKNIEANYKTKILEHKNKINSIEEINDFFKKIINKDIKDFIMIDNSNENNKNVVSVIIYYKNYLPHFNNYRKYILKNQFSRNSDVEYIKLGLEKYFSNNEEIPDLVIVDGAKQQLNEAKKLLKKINLDLPVVGLVKNDKHQTDYLLNPKGEKVLINNKNVFNFFSKIQEEVDSYAKRFYNKNKINSSLENVLFSIKGIGEKTEQKLLNHFKTYSNIYNASEQELEKVISKTLAKKIIEKFQK